MSTNLLLRLARALTFFCAALAFNAHAFTEGTDYMILEKPIPDAQNTLIKVFSYDCPFCYKSYAGGDEESRRYA